MKIVIPNENPDRFKALKRHLTGRIKIYLILGALLAALVGGGLLYKRAYVPLTKYIAEVTSGTQTSPILEAFREAEKNVTNEVRMYMENGLPTLYIDLPFEGYQKLVNKRDEALKIGILNTTDADFVDAQIHLTGGANLEAKIRLKGDWTDHLEGDKWSFRIHLKEDGEILHTRQFSIQSPETRKFLFEWAFHQNLVKEGILSPRYEFINVLLNGKLLGIYALEENFAPELIESQGRRQGVIIRLNEELMWQNWSTFWGANIHTEGQFMVTRLWNSEITPFQEGRIADDPVLAAQAEAAIGLLRGYQTGQLKASEVFDVELVGRYYALSDMWVVAHGWAWHNLRFYYNPVTARLEPVSYDNEPFAKWDLMRSMVSVYAESGLFNDPEVRAAYARNLYRLSQVSYLDDLRASLRDEQTRLRDALAVEFPNDELTVDWNELKERAIMLGLELQPAQPVRGYYQARGLEVGSDTAASLVLDVGNLMIVPVEVIGVKVNDQSLAIGRPVYLPPVMNLAYPAFEPVQMIVPLPAGQKWDQNALKVEVVTRLQGLGDEYTVALRGSAVPAAVQAGPAPRQPSLEEAILQHGFLRQSDSQALSVLPGIWDVRGDLVLPPNTMLIVPAGTVLRFEPGAILYTSGPLKFTGQASAPVLLTAQQETWGGIVVISSPEGSEWKYAAVEKMGGIDRSGWTLTGGITFFQTDIVLDHTLIGNNRTEDAINVIHGEFVFHDCEFGLTVADAFDSDFSNGSITNCTFHDIAGDALDVSGSTVTVSASRMERIGDKGVSAGEKSTVSVENVSMAEVGIGAASKDLSRVTLTGGEIRKARFAALAAYIKKPVFGPASLEASGVTILETETTAVAQTGSTILIDGTAVEARTLDVDFLYQQGILGN